MRIINYPEQRVSRKEKLKKQWTKDTADYLIDKAISMNDIDTIEKLYQAAKGNIEQDDYRKVLNPYNSTDEKYMRYPATLRNYNKIIPILRRYLGEYVKQSHEMMIVSVDPDIVFARDEKLNLEISQLALQAFINELNNMGFETGEESATIPDIDEFVSNFKADYISEKSEDYQNLLVALEVYTNSELFYYRAYFDWICTGSWYSYRTIINGKFVKRNISPLDAYPIYNNELFAKDYEAFICKDKLTMSQLLEEESENLTESDIEELKEIILHNRQGANRRASLPWSVFYKRYSREQLTDYCKENGVSGDLTKQNELRLSDLDGDTIERWHITFRTQVKKGIFTFTNEIGFPEEITVNEDFELPDGIPDDAIEWYWDEEIWEIKRFGNEHGFYTKPQPVIYQTEEKELPYNGQSELLPNLGRFSIPEIMLPFQISYNIFSFYRELTVAKLKATIMIIPESIFGNTASEIERNLHRINASGLLIYDDETIENLRKVADGIKLLNPSIENYINSITGIMEQLKLEGWESVDMTPQRYGDIGNNAGKGTTQEAILRGTIGSAIVVAMFDKGKEADYNLDLEYTKLAWVEGLTESLTDSNGVTRYVSIDGIDHSNRRYMIFARNTTKLNEQLAELKEIGFAAAQNGNDSKAFAAVTSGSIDQIQNAWKRFDAIQQKHEEDLKELDRINQEAKDVIDKALEDAKHNYKMEEIDLQGQWSAQVAKIRADSGINQWDNPPSLYRGGNNNQLLNNYLNSEDDDVNFLLDESLRNDKRLNDDRKFKLAANKERNKDIE